MNKNCYKQIKNVRFVIAYIPKGTEYYIDTGFNSVCAKQLRLTTEIVDDTVELTREELNDIFEPIVDSINKDNVCSGWFVKYDKTFIHPSEYMDDMKKDIIGIVGDIINNKIIVVALDKTDCQWCTKDIAVKDFPVIYTYDEAYKDFNGKKYTDIVKDCKCYKADNNTFPAFDYCLKYTTKGTEQGEWYLPSTGEQQIIYNTKRDKINYALFMMSKKPINLGWLSTSVRSKRSYVWGCNLGGSHLDARYHKWDIRSVQPFLSIDMS